MFKKLVSIFLCFSILSCSTNSAQKPNNQYENNKQLYGEKISHFMIGQDGKNLIIIGTKHHFNFPLDQNLREILLWSSREKLNPNFYNVDELNTGNVSVTYNLKISTESLNEDEKIFLNKHQFTLNKSQHNYWLTQNLNGEYFTANEVIPADSVKFKSNYNLFYKHPKYLTKSSNSSLEVVAGSIVFLGAIVVIVPLLAILKHTPGCQKNAPCDQF